MLLLIKREENMEYIYLIKEGNNIKIGSSNNPEKRLNTLKSGNSNDLSMLYKFESLNAKKDEKFLHKFFSSKRINGEWFALSLTDIKYIKEYFTDKDKEIKIPEKHVKRIKNLKQFNIINTEQINNIYCKSIVYKELKSFLINKEEHNFIKQKLNYYLNIYNINTYEKINKLKDLLFYILQKNRIHGYLALAHKEHRISCKEQEVHIKNLSELDKLYTNTVNFIK